jgi:multisubunit Na+/H+ antiporter MnhE subunit
MWVSYLVYAVALSCVWMAITGMASLESFAVGMLVGLGVLVLRPDPFRVQARRVPGQAIALVRYVLALLRDIILSGLDVARRVLSPDMRLKPGIIAVSTQDPEQDPTVLAMSANYISLTPGELVVEVKDNHLMFVHCLNVDESATRAEAQQTQRLAILKRMIGRAS